MFISPNIPLSNSLERPGWRCDMRLLEDEKWLTNTEVRFHLQEKKGQWHLTMIYMAADNPLKLICRKIDVFSSAKTATTYATKLQKEMIQNAIGTIKTNHDTFHFCDN